MKTVIYENCNAIFDFELTEVIERLKYYSGQNVHDVTKILDAIPSCSAEVIKIESDYFGYIVLDLIKAGKGHVCCNFCKETYDSNQLISRTPRTWERSI